MTASALASPALSESSLASVHKAQASNPIEQSLFLALDNNHIHASAPSPAPSIHSSFSTSSSATSSPSPSHAHAQIHTAQQQQQQHHHLQILGNHPVSPVACTFLDLPEDPFTPARASHLLFSDAEYRQDFQEPAAAAIGYENDSFLPYTTASSSMAGPSYMMTMARSFSDSDLSDMCESPTAMSFDASTTAALSSQVSLNQATGVCQSPLGYTAMYNNDYYVSAHQHNLYSQQHSQSQYHSHSHNNYSTSPLQSISENSSLSPRSPFSSMSMSGSCSSMTSSYPLARTLSESSIPVFQPLDSSNSSSIASSSSCNAIGTSMIKPTPKRSRGRRVSCNPDNSGCKVFTCRFDDCGKVFKRSEHLKRHVRSIHTMEKPFECPIQNCPKRFSRSDNLNQHIRIHRHNGRGDKNKTFAFTSFLQNYPAEVLTMS